MSGVNRLRVTPCVVFGLLLRLRGRNHTAVVIAIAIRAAAMITPFLCCLILLTRYSALEVDVADDCAVVCRADESARPDDGPVLSISALLAIPCLAFFNSSATSLIAWYRSSGSFARQRETIRCKSGGADVLKSLIDGAA